MCTGGAWRPLRHERHFSEASSFQSGVFLGRRMASSGRLARVLQAFDFQPAEPAVETLPDRRRRLGGPNADRPGLGFRAVGIAKRLDRRFTGIFGADFRANDRTPIDRLPGFRAHGAILQPLRPRHATPLGLEADNGGITLLPYVFARWSSHASVKL
jgi:hypothetical protein